MENTEKYEVDPPNNCPICGRGKAQSKKLWAHHLSYEPEKIVYLCRQCHSVVHWLNFIGMDALNELISWILIYGNSWINGNEKYQKSPHKKIVNKRWAQLNRKRTNENARRRYDLDPEKHRNAVRKYRAKIKERRNSND